MEKKKGETGQCHVRTVLCVALVSVASLFKFFQ